MADSNVNLNLVASLQDNASSGLAAMGNNAGNSLQAIKSQAQQVAVAFGLAGAAILAGVGLLVNSAGQDQAAITNLNTTLQDMKDAAGSATDSDATLTAQKQRLTDQINANTGSLTNLYKEYENGKITYAQYQADVDKVNQKNEQLQSEIDDITTKLTNQNLNVNAASAAFQKLAEQNVNLGFTMEDSITAYNSILQVTGSVTDATNGVNLAMNLAREYNMSLADASSAVGKIMEGNTRGLIQFGIATTQNLTPTQALALLQSRSADAAKNYATSFQGQMDVMNASMNELQVTLGTSLLPALTNLIKALDPILIDVANFAKSHQQLTEIILGGVVALGLLFAGIGLVGGAIAGAITMFEAAGIVIAAMMSPIGLLILAIAGIALGMFILYEDWGTWWKNVQELFAIVSVALESAFKSWLNEVSTAWTLMWQGMSDIFGTIWKGISDTFNNIVAGIKTGFQDLVNFIDSILKPIISAASTVGQFVSAVGKNSVSGIETAISALANIKMFASGGIVTSPTFGVVGEAGPEAVIPLNQLGSGGLGGGTNVNITINGGQFMDQNSTRKLFNVMAKQINQQLKLTHQ